MCVDLYQHSLRSKISINLKNIVLREFFGVVAYRFIDAFCRHTVQFSDVAVEDYLLVAQGDDFFFHVGNNFLLFHDFRFG